MNSSNQRVLLNHFPGRGTDSFPPWAEAGLLYCGSLIDGGLCSFSIITKK